MIFVILWIGMRILVVHVHHTRNWVRILLNLLPAQLRLPSILILLWLHWLLNLLNGLRLEVTEPVILRSWLKIVEAKVALHCRLKANQIFMLLWLRYVSCWLWSLHRWLLFGLSRRNLSRGFSRSFLGTWLFLSGWIRIFIVVFHALRLRKLSFYKSVELASFIFKHVDWVVFHVLIYPLLVHVLVDKESVDFVARGIWTRFLIWSW